LFGWENSALASLPVKILQAVPPRADAPMSCPPKRMNLRLPSFIFL
jgi:hypothetical protein